MKLTPEQLRQNAAAMLAFADGKPVQYYDFISTLWFDSEREPNWNCAANLYRPKPEPKVRPWSKPEDVPGPVCWVTYRDGLPMYQESLIINIGSDGVYIQRDIGPSRIKWETLAGMTYSTDRKTWQPCTVTET